MGELAAGLLAGLLHVWLGADHLAALAPAAAAAARRPWAPALRWALAHAAGTVLPLSLLLAGPPLAARAAAGGWAAEAAGGALLASVGLQHLWRQRRRHPHARAAGGLHASLDPASSRPLPAVFGFMHGLAGAGTLAPLLLGLAVADPMRPARVLSGFVLGSTGAMLLFCSGVHRFHACCRSRSEHQAHLFQASLGVLSLSVGAYWLADSIRPLLAG